MKYIIFIVNFIFGYFFSGMVYPPIGIAYSLLSLVIFVICYSNGYGRIIINWQLSDWSRSIWENDEDERQVLLSVALLSLSMKIGTIIALCIEIGMILGVALAILIASGWLIEGRASGMNIPLAGLISKFVVKIYNIINSLYDKLAEWVVKVEFYLLGITVK